MKILLTDAIASLRPKQSFILHEENYDKLEWLNDAPKPTREECEAELARLQAIEDANDYKVKRAAEYPDYRDYLDGIVKGDQAQIDTYISACLAVKQKYPKPGV